MPAADWQHPKVHRLLSLLSGIQTSGIGKKALCPAHHDVQPSLQVDIDTDDWKILLYCHAGCDTATILDHLGLTWPDLRLREIFRGSPIVAEYDYNDEAGQLLYQKIRLEPKDFRLRKPDGRGGWTLFLKDVRRVVYRLDELQGVDSCIVVEGEKDVDALVMRGLVATTNDSGASLTRPKWKPEYTSQLHAAGIRNAAIIPDNDEAGEAHAQAIARSCILIGIAPKIVHLPGLAEHGDVSDWLAAGGTVEQLLVLIDQADVLVFAAEPETAAAPVAEAPPEQMPPLATTEPSVDDLLVELNDQTDPWAYLERVRSVEQQYRSRFIERWLTLVAEKPDFEVDPLLAVARPVFMTLTATMKKMIGALRDANTPPEEKPRLAAPLVPVEEEVNGAAILEEIVAAIKSYMVIGDESADVMALWAAHTHVFAALPEEMCSPYLTFTSPVKRCGKTRAQSILDYICDRTVRGSNISEAALYRTVETYKPTLIIDEADSVFELNEPIRTLLNAGHDRRTAQVIRCEGDEHEPKQFSTWCPKTLALIGRNGNLPDTIADRSILVPMKRKNPNEPKPRRVTRAVFQPLGRKLRKWADTVIDEVKAAPEPEFPAALNVNDRMKDNFESLFVIADIVESSCPKENHDSCWPARARRAAIKFTPELAKDVPTPTDTDEVQLLSDLRSVFYGGSEPKEQLASAMLAATLNGLDERPWKNYKRQPDGLTQNQIAHLLGEFRIKSRTIRMGNSTPRGYVRTDFEDAWERYLGPIVRKPVVRKPVA